MQAPRKAGGSPGQPPKSMARRTAWRWAQRSHQARPCTPLRLHAIQRRPKPGAGKHFEVERPLLKVQQPGFGLVVGRVGQVGKHEREHNEDRHPSCHPSHKHLRNQSQSSNTWASLLRSTHRLQSWQNASVGSRVLASKNMIGKRGPNLRASTLLSMR